MLVHFTVCGEPVGKGRPKFARRGEEVHTYTPEKTASYEVMVGWEYARSCGCARFEDKDAISIEINAYYSIPKSMSEKRKRLMREGKLRPKKKPDGDNVIKAVFDGLNGIAYRDDAQIVDCHFGKYYSDTPRTEITLKEAEGGN